MDGNNSKKITMKFASIMDTSSSVKKVPCQDLEYFVLFKARYRVTVEGDSSFFEQEKTQMKRLLITSLAALLITLVAGVAFAEDSDLEEDQTFALPIDKPEQNYGHLEAPGVPDNIGPEDHQNTHCGENGWKADPPGNDSFNPPLFLIMESYVIW
jgi:hypothetical protein